MRVVVGGCHVAVDRVGEQAHADAMRVLDCLSRVPRQRVKELVLAGHVPGADEPLHFGSPDRRAEVLDLRDRPPLSVGDVDALVRPRPGDRRVGKPASTHVPDGELLRVTPVREHDATTVPRRTELTHAHMVAESSDATRDPTPRAASVTAHQRQRERDERRAETAHFGGGLDPANACGRCRRGAHCAVRALPVAGASAPRRRSVALAESPRSRWSATARSRGPDHHGGRAGADRGCGSRARRERPQGRGVVGCPGPGGGGAGRVARPVPGLGRRSACGLSLSPDLSPRGGGRPSGNDLPGRHGRAAPDRTALAPEHGAPPSSLDVQVVEATGTARRARRPSSRVAIVARHGSARDPRSGLPRLTALRRTRP